MATRLHCSFCQKPDTEVRKLVAGGGGGYICDQCVAIAAHIMANSDPPSDSRSFWQRARSRFRTLLGQHWGEPKLRASAPAA